MKSSWVDERPDVPYNTVMCWTLQELKNMITLVDWMLGIRWSYQVHHAVYEVYRVSGTDNHASGNGAAEIKQSLNTLKNWDLYSVEYTYRN